MSPAADTPPRAGVREWLGLTVLALPVLLLALDLTVLHLALPHLAADLNPSAVQQLWILDIYGFLVAGFLVTMGGLADRIGRRRLLLIGAAAFGLASLAAAFATSPAMLIAARALLGVAGATFTPSSLSLLSNMFRDPRQRGFAMAVWMACFASGAAVGPSIGGLLLEWFWWGAVFLLGVPVMLLLLAAGPFLLPEYRSPDPGRLDPLSVLLSLVAILLVVYAVKDAAKDGWQLSTGAVLLAGLAAGWVFVRRQRGLDSPLVDLTLFRHRAFSVGLGTLLLCGVAGGSVVMLLSQYLQLMVGLSPLAAGLWLLPQGLASIPAALLAPALATRIGPGRTTALATLCPAVGLLSLTQVGGDGGFGFAIAGSIVLSLGMGLGSAVMVDLVVNSAPKEKSGSASSVFETVGELGQATGIATLGAVATAVYRFGIADTVPEGTPRAAAEATRDSMPAAAAAAADLGGEAGDALLAAARDAFATGITTVGYVGAALLLLTAVMAWRYLPNTRTGDSEGSEDTELVGGGTRAD
ncbi:MFS transporter [Halostreptopolyspora alba]|uniref:MFS transporter n=1 Tax=Halostreptopolyspora alba TaxID=2487137 RepID=A0A3N0EHJ2_9ACTN|nr:MFS transporter [Nocardiopsaceae bacterium YIM 96095]